MKRHITIIEDEVEIGESLTYFLKHHGFDVNHYLSAEAFFSDKSHPDRSIYLVDWNLPGIKGVDIIRTIRHNDKLSPVFMISAYNKPTEVISGLKSGADDYLSKPFNFDELLVRVENAYNKIVSLSDDLMNLGVKFLPEAHAIIKDGVTVNLTSREYIIFDHLYEFRSRPSTREELISKFDAEEGMTTRNIDVHIFSLRKKLDRVKVKIETIWGTGYQLQLEDEEAAKPS